MRKYIMLVGLVAIIVLTGCAVRPTPDQLSNADYGPYPNDYEKIVKDHYAQSLFDPYSAVFTFRGSPSKGWSGFGQVKFGWRVCGTLNAKNRLGGYVGAKPFYALIYNGNVVQSFEDLMAQGACNN